MFFMGQTFKSNLNGLRTTFQVAFHLIQNATFLTEIQQAIVRIQHVLRQKNDDTFLKMLKGYNCELGMALLKWGHLKYPISPFNNSLLLT